MHSTSHSPYSLNELQPIELHLLLEHMRLGREHLKQVLSLSQYHELLQWGTLTQEQEAWIESSKAERIGNAILVVNTIMTSVFGAWMGLSGCTGCSLGATHILIPVALLAFLLSAWIGYNSFKYTKQQARHAIENQKIHNLELETLKIINQKLDGKIESLQQYLETSLFLLEHDKKNLEERSENPINFATTQQAFDWLKHLKRVLKNRLEQFHHNRIYRIYMRELIHILRNMGNILVKSMRVIEPLTFPKDINTAQHESLQHIYQIPFVHILTDPKLTIPKMVPQPLAWWQGNLLAIALGLTPAILGGFASMFVFVSGGPNVVRELGWISLANLLTEPFSRVLEVTAALIITLYFAFSYLHSNRKLSQRQRLLDQTQKEITNEETRMVERNNKLSMLLKIKGQVQKLVSIFTILKRIDNYLQTDNNTRATDTLEAKQ